MESTNQNINHSIENKIKYTRFKELSLANNVTLSIADSGKTVDTIKRADRIGHIITTPIVYILLIALALIVIFPFYWMIITSLNRILKLNKLIKHSSHQLSCGQTMSMYLIRLIS